VIHSGSSVVLFYPGSVLRHFIIYTDETKLWNAGNNYSDICHRALLVVQFFFSKGHALLHKFGSSSQQDKKGLCSNQKYGILEKKK